MQKQCLFNNLNPFDPIEKIIPQFIKSISQDIDYSSKYPFPITTKGKEHLTNPLFWIIFIRFKILFAEKNKKWETLLRQINHACQYEIVNRHLLYNYYALMVDLFVDKRALSQYIWNCKQIKIDNILRREDYNLLLKNKEFFRKKKKKKDTYNDYGGNNKKNKTTFLYNSIISHYNDTNRIVKGEQFTLLYFPQKNSAYKQKKEFHVSFISRKRRRG